MPFKWSYSVVQGGGALGGFLLGATVALADARTTVYPHGKAGTETIERPESSAIA